MASILCIAGSARADSFNRQLLLAGSRSLAEQGATAVPFDVDMLRGLPLMDQDLEAQSGLPADAVQLKQAFADADGVLFACPEYNGSVTPLLKNAIDWVSRPHDSLPAAKCFAGKPMALLGASPGALGGLRGLRHVREILGNLGALVVPRQFALGRAGDAFADDGSGLVDAKQQEAVSGVVEDLLRWTRAAAETR